MPLPTTSNTDNPQSRGFGARLDDLLLRLAESPDRPLTIRDAEMEADRVNTAQTPEAYLSAFGDVFARSAFWGGEGLRFAHRRDAPSNAYARFWASEGASVQRPSDRADAGVSLHPEMENLAQTSTNTKDYVGNFLAYNPFTGSLADTEKLYLITGDGGNDLTVTTDPLGSDPYGAAGATEHPEAGEGEQGIFGLAFLGNTTYAGLGGNGIHRDPEGANAWEHWNDLSSGNIWGVKGRIMATDSGSIPNSLYEVASSGAAPSPLKTLDEGFVWNDVVDGGAAVLAAASDGYIYAFTLNDSDALVESGQSYLSGEIPVAMVSTRGLIFYSTKHLDESGAVGRLWQAELDSSTYTLTNIQLLRAWEDDSGTTERVPDLLIVGNDAIYTGIPVEGGGSTDLWCYSLADGAMTKIVTMASTEYLLGIEDVSGRIFVHRATNATPDGTLDRQATTYQASGHLIGPLGDLFTADDKSWVTAKLAVADLGDGREVDFLLTTNPDAVDDPNHADWTLVKTYTSPDDSEIAIQQFSRYIAGMVKLRPSTDSTLTPRVRSFAFRSYPGPGDLLIEVPVNVSDQIATPGRRPRRVQGWGKTVLNELLNRSGREATLELYRHGITITGLLERVSTPSPETGEAGSPQAHAMLRFRGRKATLVTS